MRQRYRIQWESDPIFKKWLTQTEFDDRAACACCGCELNARHSDLLRHSQTSKHLRALENFNDEIPLTKVVPKIKTKRPQIAIKQNKISNVLTEDQDPIGETCNYDVNEVRPASGPVSESHTKLDVKLLSTLREIDNTNCLFLFDRCKELNVNARQLRYFEKDHVRDLIPKTHLGILAEFEYLLKEWKIRKGFARSETKVPKDVNKKTPLMTSKSIQTEDDDDNEFKNFNSTL